VDFSIRPARAGDLAAIAAFTRETFPWGDYVPEAFPRWLEEPGLAVFVAVDRSDAAVAVAHVGMLGPEEAWAGGMRVAPAVRRRGIADRLVDVMLEWAATQGARVGRLVVEEWNEPAIAQAAGRGFRPVGRWMMVARSIGDASPNPDGNGGLRVPSEERLRRVPAVEADVAFMAWQSGDLVRAARELFPVGWEWRRLRLEDLRTAAEHGELWAGPPGWALAGMQDETFAVTWIETGSIGAYPLARALVDAALDAGAERLEVKIPNVDWLVRALRRVGCSVEFELRVFARSLPGASPG
jgi:ribosomal protein S18 acetylase RimI-like enzyme